VRRGELWIYYPHGSPQRRRTVVLISSDGINESSRQWLIAAEILDQDPQDILAVSVPQHGWVHAGNIGRIYRGWLAECVDVMGAEELDRLDTALRAAMDL
jgi:mRNA interferase MazF